jgi:hypothetical protein
MKLKRNSRIPNYLIYADDTSNIAHHVSLVSALSTTSCLYDNTNAQDCYITLLSQLH